MRAEHTAKGRAWYQANPEKSRERVRRWQRENPARCRDWNGTYQARKHAAEGSHTDAEWDALCQEHQNCCASCGENHPLTRDHIVPLSQGGTDWITNIQPLCNSCNSAKGTKTIHFKPSPS